MRFEPDQSLPDIRIAEQILRSALPEADWVALENGGRPKVFEKGDTIFRRGDRAEQFFFIREGRIEISIVLASGQKAVLNQMGAGEVLGEIAVLDGGARTADATVASDEAELVAIGQRHLLDVLAHSPTASLALIRELCRRVRNASDMFEVKSEKSARVRLARTILRVSMKWGERRDGATLIAGFSQGELGELAGLARENVNRQLGNWEAEGLIRREGETLHLLQPEAIADEAML